MSEIIQGSDEWHKMRLGKVTASRVKDALAKTQSGWSKSRVNYMAELLCERLTGQREEGFVSNDMSRGKELEGEARTLYEFQRDLTVREVGFVDHPTIEMTGCSPDGLVGEYGGVEIKCLKQGNHLECLLNGTIPPAHRKQIHWCMACTGREWWDFAAYHPSFPVDCQLFVSRMHRDEDFVKELEAGVTDFLVELNSKVAQIEEQMKPPVLMAG